MNVLRLKSFDILASEDQTRAWEEIDAARRQLKIRLDKLIAIVRERYIEVDIDKTNIIFVKASASIRESVQEDE